jgi:hypothetical protein
MGQQDDDRQQHGQQRQSVLDQNYLKNGYFRDRDCKELDPYVVDRLAFKVAQALVEAKTKSGQMRRYLNQLRAIERTLDTTKTFDLVKADIANLKSDAAMQVGRGLVGGDFKRFIDRNVDLAMQRECDFRRGFILHFQSVYRYFVYLTRGRV